MPAIRHVSELPGHRHAMTYGSSARGCAHGGPCGLSATAGKAQHCSDVAVAVPRPGWQQAATGALSRASRAAYARALALRRCAFCILAVGAPGPPQIESTHVCVEAYSGAGKRRTSSARRYAASGSVYRVRRGLRRAARRRALSPAVSCRNRRRRSDRFVSREQSRGEWHRGCAVSCLR